MANLSTQKSARSAALLLALSIKETRAVSGKYSLVYNALTFDLLASPAIAVGQLVEQEETRYNSNIVLKNSFLPIEMSTRFDVLMTVENLRCRRDRLLTKD
jgi:hypothetical protein